MTIRKIYKKYNCLFSAFLFKTVFKMSTTPLINGYVRGFSTFSIIFLTKLNFEHLYTICLEVLELYKM